MHTQLKSHKSFKLTQRAPCLPEWYMVGGIIFFGIGTEWRLKQLYMRLLSLFVGKNVE